MSCEVQNNLTPLLLGETIEQWLQSAFPATICVMLLTTKHLSITPGLQLLAHCAIDSKVSWRGYCNGTLYCLWPFFIQCFVLPTLTEVGFLNAMKLLKWSFLTVPCFFLFFFHRWTYLRGVIMVLITVASKYVLSVHVWDMFFKNVSLNPFLLTASASMPGSSTKNCPRCTRTCKSSTRASAATSPLTPK